MDNNSTCGTDRICRFCLSHERLMALSEVVGSAFSFEDVQYYTGIRISENEQVALCNECCVAIHNSVNFRHTCLSNDAIFRKVLLVLKTRVVLAVDSTHSVINSVSQHSTEDTTLEEDVINDTGFIALDDAGPDEDSIDNIDPIEMNYLLEKSTSDNSRTEQVQSTVTEEGRKENETTTEPNLHELGTLDSFHDSNDGISVTSTIPEVKRTTNDIVRSQTTLPVNAGSCENWTTAVESDSDDSVVSLFSEFVAKSKEEFFKKRKEMLTTRPSSEEKGNENTTDATKACAKTLDDADSNDSRARGSQIMKPKPPRIFELCPYCGVLTRDWLSHISRTHIKEGRFACGRCPKKFTEKFALKEHWNTAHEKRITKTCEICGKGFICHGSHYYHMTNVHGKADVYECETCHRKLKSYDGYKKHLKIHSLTSQPCTYCGKVFKTTETLEKHHLRYHASKP